ncbi:glycosyltransferase family 2 protein [Mariniluteicoccus flavus]
MSFPWPDDTWPAVSYVMPVLNEESYLTDAIASVLDQDYPGENEVVLALGPSRDRTTALAEAVAAADPRIHIVHNPGTDIPKGLNLAIAASRHPIVVRVDAHSELPPDYTRRAVATLRETGAVNVGGLMVAAGRSPFQRAVARAYNSPIGLGGGTYHSGGEAGPCESAYLGVFRREALAQVGGYDESVRRGEDWELNLRIREAGHTVWFTPELAVTYWPRDSVERLARQFWSTGAWRGHVMRRVWHKTPLRFFAPGALVAGTAAACGIAAADAAGLVRGPGRVLRVAYAGPLSYAALLGAYAARGDAPAAEKARFAQVVAVMHYAWGAGWWSGMLRGAEQTVDTSRHTRP